MSLKTWFVFTFFFSHSIFASSTCEFDLTKAFDKEIISNSHIVRDGDSFDHVTDELLHKGYIKKSDLADINTSKAELTKIEDELREEITQKLNPNGNRSGRQFESQVKLELEKKLKENSEQQDWLSLQIDSRTDVLHQINQNQPSGRAFDFSNNHTFSTSITRVKSLDGIEPTDAQDLLNSGNFPDVIYRYDNNFKSSINSKGLPKASLITLPSGRRILKPVNANGDGNIANHIAADNAQNRSASPFLSFSGDASSVERFGNKSISINVKGLLEGISSGKVTGVDIITAPQLRKGARAKLTSQLDELGFSNKATSKYLNRIRKIANESTGNLTHEQSDQIQNVISEIVENTPKIDKKIKNKLIDELNLNINFLRHSITNNEVLIRGSVPEDYLNIPKNI